jgi:hypothetical protein
MVGTDDDSTPKKPQKPRDLVELENLKSNPGFQELQEHLRKLADSPEMRAQRQSEEAYRNSPQARQARELREAVEKMRAAGMLMPEFSEPEAPTSSASPAQPQTLPGTSTKAAISKIAADLKRDGKIPADISITGFAHMLEDEVRKAIRAAKAVKRVPSIKPVKWQHIRNNLRAWGLWPISNIK